MPRDQFIATRTGTNLGVALSGALPAGTNNIGDVDVLTLPALPAGTNDVGIIRPRPAGITLAAAGSVAAPAAAGTAIATIAAPPAGAYEVEVDAGVVGTSDGPVMLELRRGATVISGILTVGTVADLRFPRIDLSGTEAVSVVTTGVGTATYAAAIRVTRLS